MNFLGIDIGGTGVKAGLVSDTGELLGFARYPVEAYSQQPGWAEADMNGIRQAAVKAVHEAVDGRPVAGLSISSQGQTFAPFDKNGIALHPAIIWYDKRMQGETSQFIPISTAAKIQWLNKHKPEVLEQCSFIMLLPDYLTWLLTGNRVIDKNTAGSTGLIIDGEYSDDLLAAAAITPEAMSQIAIAGSPAGTVTPAAAAEWGLPEGVPVIVGTNDQYAGGLGGGNCESGIITETTGTCLALVTLCNTLPDPLPHGLFGGVYPLPDTYFLLAFSRSAGLMLDQIREFYCQEQSHEELQKAAAAIPPGSDGLRIIPPIDEGGILFRAEDIHALFVNAGEQYTPAHYYRTAMETVALDMRYHIEQLQAAGYEADTIRSIGGGAKSDLWLQIKADVLGKSIERPRITEAAVLGAAMIAAAGTNAFASLEDCSRSLYQADKTFKPEPKNRGTYNALYVEDF